MEPVALVVVAGIAALLCSVQFSRQPAAPQCGPSAACRCLVALIRLPFLNVPMLELNNTDPGHLGC